MPPSPVSKVKLPLWRCSTMRRAVSRPMPVPLPGALVVKNGSKIRDCTSAGIPGPSSAMSTRTQPLSASVEIEIVHSDRLQSARIVHVEAQKERVRPGDSVPVWIDLEDFRGGPRRVVMTATGARPAFAQVELAGSWAARNHEDALERGGGPYAVDYTGIPINDEARKRALSYSASQLSMIERQCSLWAQYYLVTGPFGMKISNETDPIDGSTIVIA